MTRAITILAFLILGFVAFAQERKDDPKHAIGTSCANSTSATVNGETVPCLDVDVSITNQEKRLEKSLTEVWIANKETIRIAQYLADKNVFHGDLPKVILSAKKAIDDLCRRFACEEKTK